MNLPTQGSASHNLDKTAAEAAYANQDRVYRGEPEALTREIESALREYFPIENSDGRARLELKRVWIDDRKDSALTPGAIADARYKGTSHSLPVRGEFDLIIDGKKVDTGRVKLGPYFPVVPGLNTRLVDGKLYQNKLQVRRMAGVYPFKNERGESMVDFNTSRGRSFNLAVDLGKENHQTVDVLFTGKNRKAVKRGGYAMLRAFGHSDDDIKQAWGEDLWKQNATNEKGESLSDKDVASLIDKVYNGFKSKVEEKEDAPGLGAAAKRLRERLEENESVFSPEVTRQTLGIESDRFTPDLMMGATQKLLSVYSGKEEPPHRFSERFRRLHGVPTQIREALNHRDFQTKFVGSIKNRLEQAASGHVEPKVSTVMQTAGNKIRSTVRKGFVNSQLTTATETNNLLDIEGRSKEVTIRGPGGVQSNHAVQGETVNLHPSRLGLMDFVKTQVAAPGVTHPLAMGAEVEGSDVKRRVYDRKQKRIRLITSEEASEGGVAFPDEFERFESKGVPHWRPKSPKVRAAIGDDVRSVAESSVRYVVTDPTHLLSEVTNLTPFIAHDAGARAIMGANQMTQALALSDPESPLVETLDAEGVPFSKRLGDKYNAVSPFDGEIVGVGRDWVDVREKGKRKPVRVPVLREFPLNQGSFLDQKPVVKTGDKVSAGDPLTRNNYNDSEGKLAVGRNLAVAYMPMKGANYEDAIAMSESGASKLSSVHMKTMEVEVTRDDKVDPNTYHAYMAKRGKGLDARQRAQLTKDGVVKKGTKLQKGDLVATVISMPSSRSNDELTARLNSTLQKMRVNVRNKSLYWEYPFEGEVVQVVSTPTLIRVFVKTKEPFKVGDKLSAFHGNKGIVSVIIPDEEVPHMKNPRTGEMEPVDIMVDPHGIPSRINPGQLLETAAAKVAVKTGKPYQIKNYDPDALKKVRDDLKRHGLTDKEELFVPATGEKIPGVNVGYQYFGKLKHQLDKKFSARGASGGYDAEGQPTGGAAIDNLTLHALIGHNARANVAEMARLKGTRNEDYWEALAAGRTPRMPSAVPFSSRKLMGMIEGLGVKVEKGGPERVLKLRPMTDKDVEQMSAGAVTEGQGYKVLKQGLKEMPSGLFDFELHGTGGKRMTHIDAPEKVPNPLFSKAIASLITEGSRDGDAPRVIKNGKNSPISSLAQSDIEKVYTGDVKLKFGDEELEGPEALQRALRSVDLDLTVKDLTEKLKREVGTGRVKAGEANDKHTALRYARNLKENDIRPEDGYMTSKIPVIPLEFRQPLELKPGQLQMPAVNNAYAALIKDSEALREQKKMGMPDEYIREYRKHLISDLGALMGAKGARAAGKFETQSLADLIAKPKTISGSNQFDFSDTDSGSAKDGYAQQKVVKRKMEVSGRTTIIPSVKLEADDDVDVDEVGLPEEMAWKMYEPFVRGRMSRALGSASKAKKAVTDRTPQARVYLEQEMRSRPVLLNRAPSWWKYNVMAFKPKLVATDPEDPSSEKALRVPGLVIAPYFGGDYDGDALSVHVPSEKDAVNEAFGLLPSKHLRAPGDKSLMLMPAQSMLMGLHMMTEWDESGKVEPVADPEAEYLRGDLPLSRVVIKNGKRTTAGFERLDRRIRRATSGELTIDQLLGELNSDRKRFHFTKRGAKELMGLLADKYPKHYAPVVRSLSSDGEQAATKSGFSVGLSDLTPMRDKVNAEVKRVEPLVERMAVRIAKEEGGKVSDKHRDEARVALYMSPESVSVKDDKDKHESVAMRLGRAIKEGDSKDNSLFKMMSVGSKGNPSQMRQMLAAPLMVNDAMKKVVPVPILSSYAEGLSTSEYYAQQGGALSGLRDRSVETSRPGDLGKQIVSTAADMVITTEDCRTSRGVNVPTTDANDLVGRYLASAAGGLPSGHLITRIDVAKLQRSQTVKLRSPLRCEAPNGVCAKCFGLDENGRLPKKGRNVGVEQGQAIVQPATSMTLKSFHQSGSADNEVVGFDRFEEILNLKRPQNKAAVVRLNNRKGQGYVIINAIDEKKTRAGTTARIVRATDDRGQKVDFRIEPGRRILSNVRPGAKLSNGDPMTHGDLDPSDVEAVRGRSGLQDFLVGEINGVMGLGRRNAETVVAAMSSKGVITDPGDSEYSPFDVARVAEIRAFNATPHIEMNAAKAKGRVLVEEVKLGFGNTLKVGHTLTADDAAMIAMKKGPSHSVRVEKRKAMVTPQVLPVRKAPELGEDWLPKLNFRHVKQRLTEAAIRGQKAQLHGPNPIGSYMYGAEFSGGEGRWRY